MATINSNSDSVYIDMSESLELYDKKIINGRKEQFLYALCALDYEGLPVPLSRIELWLNGLVTGDVPTIEPQSRNEYFLKAILTGDTTNLPVPQSRVEILLNKLANGYTDLSDCEPIQSRYEFLLSYLIKNGGIGGDIEYITYKIIDAFETLYTTAEKPVKSLKLSGDTLVNCVLEDTENDDYTSFDKDYSGTSFTINGTSEGAIKSAILSGQTLVNLVPKKIIDYTASNDWDGFNVLVQNSKRPNEHWRTLQDLKPNTKYYISCYVETFEDVNSRNYHLNNPNDNCLFVDFMSVNGVGHYQWISTTRSEFTDATYLVLRCQNAYARGRIKIRDIMVIEYQDGMENWDIPYFEGMSSVKMPVLTTTGKNLLPSLNYISPKDALNLTKGNIRVNNGAIYSLTMNSLVSSTGLYRLGIMAFKNGENITNSNTITFTKGSLVFRDDVYKRYQTSGDASELSDLIFTVNDDVELYIALVKGTNTDVNSNAIAQLEKGSVATSYEPYKSNILTANEDIELRGIGEVRDELNLLNGEVVKKTGVETLDENSNWSNVSLYDNVVECAILGTDIGQILISDTIPIGYGGDIERVCCVNGNIFVAISKTKLTSYDLIGIKNYLKTKPINIIYSLKQSTVKTVVLNVADQNNNKIDKIHVFDEVTHINASSNELTPTVNIDKSVSYPTIIKPNTKYTVDLKRNDKQLIVNLGGTEVTFTDNETHKIIATPSTLTNDKLSYYGIGAKCNKIMLIEGEIEKNIDYFTGMQSVRMPVLCTTGKNLWDSKWYEGYSDNGGGGVLANTTLKNAFRTNYIPCSFNDKITAEIFDKTVPLNNNFIYYNLFDNNYNRITTTIGLSPTNRTLIINNNQAKYIVFHVWNSEPFTITTEKLMVVRDDVITSYEPYKSNILTVNEEVELGSVGEVKDELDLLTGKITQRTDIRPYQESDESDSEVLTDMTNTRYKLAQEVVKTVDLTVLNQDNQPTKLGTFENLTHVSLESAGLIPEVEMEVATRISKELASASPLMDDISMKQEQLNTTIDEQSNNVDATMIATTEIYEETL